MIFYQIKCSLEFTTSLVVPTAAQKKKMISFGLASRSFRSPQKKSNLMPCGVTCSQSWSTANEFKTKDTYFILINYTFWMQLRRHKQIQQIQEQSESWEDTQAESGNPEEALRNSVCSERANPLQVRSGLYITHRKMRCELNTIHCIHCWQHC